MASTRNERRMAEGGKRILDNFLSLSVLQFTHYAAPLITLPSFLPLIIGLSNVFGVRNQDEA